MMTKRVSVFVRIERELLDGRVKAEEVELQDVKIRVRGEGKEHPDFDAFSETTRLELEGVIVSKRGK